MNIFEELGINKYINAHDTYTIYGGSRISISSLTAMSEISRDFVDIHELQTVIGDRVAELTKNNAAYICNGASAGLLLTSSVCMVKNNQYLFSKLPDTSNVPNEFILFRCQRNGYDKAIEASGAKLIEIGDADCTHEFELEGAITARTAGIIYFQSSLYERASLPLEDTIRIAHKHNIPVIVDAAAQLPPVDNLWKFTEMGADFVIFSGGKTLCGPQDSGIVFGSKKMIELCRMYGAPNHGICRSSKISREAMVSLYIAIKEYMAIDHSKQLEIMHHYIDMIANSFSTFRSISSSVISKGPVGQDYPRLFVRFPTKQEAKSFYEYMLNHRIYTGLAEFDQSVYFSPLNINADELDIICERIREYTIDE